MPAVTMLFMSAKTVALNIKQTGAALGTHIVLANNPWLRLKGLLGQRQLPQGAGLWLVPCNSVHMAFMLMNLDLVYLDKDLNVLRLLEHVVPWQGCPWVKQAHSVLELPEGTIGLTGLKVGYSLAVS